jgi:DNA-binding ferritin-like protein (Dps family)
MAKWYEMVTGTISDKLAYRAYRARLAALPEPYRTAGAGLDRYITYAGGVVKSDVMLKMYDDLAQLLEEHAAARTPVRDIVGEDPVLFVEEFLANYADGAWVNKEKQRLVDAIDRAAGWRTP